MSLRPSIRPALLALLAGTALSPTAALADEEKAIPPLKWQTGQTEIVVYGQVNEGALMFDDGQDRTSYGLVANSNSSNRLGIKSNTALDGDATLYGNFEFQYVPHPSASVNQLDPNAANYDLDKTDIRKMEVAYLTDNIGKFWFGQGSMASDGSTEIDLSGTGVIAYSSVSDIGGGLFRMDDGLLSDVSTGSAYSNYDGLGRKMRVRYDTPTFSGFTLSASYGQDVLNDDSADLYDVAARYDRDYGSINLGSALAWSRNDGSDSDIVSGSISGLHEPTGISLTFAAAQKSAGYDSSYGYIKLGWQRDFFTTGTTAFAVDYYSGQDIVNDGSESRSWGLAMVQNVDRWNSQWYLGIRNYEYEDAAADYQDGLATMIGLIVKF